ncbi:MAG: hypothetical protein U5J95_01000 [Balneolaceae bacterium]|nr:hypothetical protein [Balneolaceae bacterium]
MQQIYFDHAATTPLDERVLDSNEALLSPNSLGMLIRHTSWAIMPK